MEFNLLEGVCVEVYLCVHISSFLAVPVIAPADVRISRSSSTVTVMWRPLTLVEARGFIEYIVQLFEVPSSRRQSGLMQRIPMNQGNATFTGLDRSSDYEASVGTISVSGDSVGPGMLNASSNCKLQGVCGWMLPWHFIAREDMLKNLCLKKNTVL